MALATLLVNAPSQAEEVEAEVEVVEAAVIVEIAEVAAAIKYDYHPRRSLPIFKPRLFACKALTAYEKLFSRSRIVFNMYTCNCATRQSIKHPSLTTFSSCMLAMYEYKEVTTSGLVYYLEITS
ncbi:hypothetical protein B566_EDAN004384 [Ephemera danica]|nr:hypothetical protein B566_EDAN004384 [Ephemera danica]